MKMNILMVLLLLVGCAAGTSHKIPMVETPPPPTEGLGGDEGNCTVLECVSILARNGFYQWGCPTVPDTVQFTWTYPDSGTQPALYIVRAEQRGEVYTTLVTFYITTDMDSLRVAVAGVDSLGRSGPWSEWSEWYHYEHAH